MPFAVHTRVIFRFCGQSGLVTTVSLKVTMGLASQLSVALAKPVRLGLVGSAQSCVMVGGTESAGGIVSTTRMVWTPVAALPLLHVSRQ